MKYYHWLQRSHVLHAYEHDDMIYPSPWVAVIFISYSFLNLSVIEDAYLCISPIAFSSLEAVKLYNFIIKYKSWPYIVIFKKHKAVSHCCDVPNNILSLQKNWKKVSGIYKITFLPFRIFTYYGSSVNLGARFKYHYFNGNKQLNFLGIFLKQLGWAKFSITVVEICPINQLASRENWYLDRFKPLLNVLTSTSVDPRRTKKPSLLTRSKISAALRGRKDSEATRSKKSETRIGAKNPFYGKGPGTKALTIAAEKAGIKVYAYDVYSFTLVNGEPFRSIRIAVKGMPISFNTLSSKLNTGKPFKGYYYFTSSQAKPPM